MSEAKAKEAQKLAQEAAEKKKIAEAKAQEAEDKAREADEQKQLAEAKAKEAEDQLKDAEEKAEVAAKKKELAEKQAKIAQKLTQIELELKNQFEAGDCCSTTGYEKEQYTQLLTRNSRGTKLGVDAEQIKDQLSYIKSCLDQ